MNAIQLRPVDSADGQRVVLAHRLRDGREICDARIGDAAFEAVVQRSSPNSGVLRIGDGVNPYWAARRNDRVSVWVDGRTYEFEIVGSARKQPPAAAGALADLIAPMPGIVRAVRVEVDHCFTAHEPLVILESMKMEMTLSAPAPGRVSAVQCRVGELVEMGAVLLKLEGVADDAGHES